MTQQDRFNRPGSNRYEVIGSKSSLGESETLVTIHADFWTAEGNFWFFFNGRPGEEKVLIASVKLDPNVHGLMQMPLDEEHTKKLLEWHQAGLSRDSLDHFANFIDPVTGETYKQYLDARKAAEKDDPFIWDGRGSYDTVAFHRHVHLTNGRCIKNGFGALCEQGEKQ